MSVLFNRSLVSGKGQLSSTGEVDLPGEDRGDKLSSLDDDEFDSLNIVIIAENKTNPNITAAIGFLLNSFFHN